MLKKLKTVTSAILPMLVAACGGGNGNDAQLPNNSVQVLSSRAEMVTGGDAVIAISGDSTASSTSAAALKVDVNGKDVSSSLVYEEAQKRLIGRVTNLSVGENTITAKDPSGSASTVKVINASVSGPVFAGKRQTPWICETEASGLGLPLDSNCTVPKRYDWYYYSTTGSTLKPLPSLSPPYPSDLATTTTIDGNKVNFIVRVESGTIDQAIYRIALLDDPANPISNPWDKGGKKPGSGWNGKLNLAYGGGCSAGYRSGSSTMPADLMTLPITSDTAIAPLSLGFAVAFTSRMTLNTGCDFVISAENSMMLKEYFTEQYGIPKFTIGTGGSGGSMQQNFIAQSYPGLLDAITRGNSFPDLASILPDVVDCVLLNDYFDAAAPGSWPLAAQARVGGYPTSGTSTTCRSWSTLGRQWVTPNLGFTSAVPSSAIFNAVTNPTGARGDFVDSNVNIFGIDSQTGYARTIYDNVGVQYGLQPLNNGDISIDQFLDLNAKIGGIDINGKHTAARTSANVQGIQNAFRSGLIFSGAGVTLPVIDSRIYLDNIANIHTRIRTFSNLARLQAANGTSANQVNWVTARDENTPNLGVVNLTKLALIAHNEWLERIAADKSADNYATKVIKNKPASLVDKCYDSSATPHEEPATMNTGATCNKLLPIFSTARLVAGESIAQDVMKCQLKPVAASDYKVIFTPAQLAKLHETFPDGVCDWTKPSIGKMESTTWQRY